MRPRGTPPRRRSLLAWGTLGAILLASPAFGLECDDIRAKLEERKADPPRRISILLTDGCLGGGSDQQDQAKKIRNEVLDTQAEDRVERVLRALDLLHGALTEEFNAAPEKARDSVGALDKMVLESGRTVRSIGACLAKNSVPPALAPSRFMVNTDSLEISQPPEVDLKKVLGPTCGEGSTADCSSELAVAETLARISTLAESTLTYYTACYIDAADEYATVLDRKWTTYFDGARSQYPWELAFNGWRMDKNDTRPMSNGNRLGFRQPPDYQWILGHPSVALEYVSDAPDGQQFKPAVLVEVLGYNRWKYKPDGSMGNALGVSAIALFADRGEVKDLGYGLMMHVHNTYSVGVTRHGSDTGFVVSGDVSDLWLKVSQKWRARLPAR